MIKKEVIIMAKALRAAYSNTQSNLLKETYMGDEYLAKKVREMQDQYKVFKDLCKKIETEDRASYEEHILGIKSSESDA